MTAGAIAYRVGGVPDDAARLRAVLEDQLGRADLIVTSGGVSVGAYDVVKEVFAEYGGVDFRRLRMQPGKPQGFGRIGPGAGVPLLALPGNPVSAYISFELFVRPAIRTMLGAEDVHRPVVRAHCPVALRSPMRPCGSSSAAGTRPRTAWWNRSAARTRTWSGRWPGRTA